jgi:hypothetical protein
MAWNTYKEIKKQRKHISHDVISCYWVHFDETKMIQERKTILEVHNFCSQKYEQDETVKKNQCFRYVYGNPIVFFVIQPT